MTPLRLSACLFVVTSTVVAQPALVEPPEFPMVQPGPQAVSAGAGCFLLAEGVILPGDVDWIRVRIPRASSRTVIDVDFPAGTSGSALLAMVTNGSTGFNVSDNNNTRDALCGLHADSSPVGSPSDSAVDLSATSLNASIQIAITGAADTSFVGLHMENFAYAVWAYTEPFPCAHDSGCNDGLVCTVDHCNVNTGDCTNDPQDDFCDDGVFCDGAERCVQGVGCREGAAPTCNDNVACTEDICHHGLDQCANLVRHNRCDNGLFCDGDELCEPGVGCVPGEAMDCDDGMDCTIDACDEEQQDCTRTASNDACDDGQFCNGAETCDLENGCMAGLSPCPHSECRENDDRCVDCMADSDCRDDLFCNGNERCNSAGLCVSGGYPCGESMCREGDDQCVECLTGSDCADGAFCNGIESCNTAGHCEAGGYPCNDRLCRENDDRCVECLDIADCDDGEFCNGAEACNAAGRCVDGVYPCDELMCRESDGRCVDCLAEEDCDDSLFCNGVERCDAHGDCVPGADPCGEDECREADDRCVQCLADDDCADDLFCNGDEHCQGSGVCASGVSPCSAGQSCNESTDRCVARGFTMDIRPGACPARLMTSGRGYLPIAIIGDDVDRIEINSIRLVRLDGIGRPVNAAEGLNGQGPRFRDESGPTQPCECSENGPDGDDDLIVSFKVDTVVQSLRLEKLRPGTQVRLQVQGKLRNGRPFSAMDCVIIQSGGGVNGTATVD